GRARVRAMPVTTAPGPPRAPREGGGLHPPADRTVIVKGSPAASADCETPCSPRAIIAGRRSGHNGGARDSRSEGARRSAFFHGDYIGVKWPGIEGPEPVMRGA